MPKTHEQRLKSRGEILAHRRNTQLLGFDFPLTATSLGMDEVQVAQVRRITLSDQSSIDQIPNDLQQIVNEGLANIEKEQKRIQDEGANTDTLRDRVANASRFLPSADAFCLATFIEPKLVRSESDLEQYPEAWVVSDIDSADRIDWFWACLNADSEAAKKLKPFRPKSPIDVQGRTVGDDRGQTTVRPAEVALNEEPGAVTILPGGSSAIQ